MAMEAENKNEAPTRISEKELRHIHSFGHWTAKRTDERTDGQNW